MSFFVFDLFLPLDYDCFAHAFPLCSIFIVIVYLNFIMIAKFLELFQCFFFRLIELLFIRNGNFYLFRLIFLNKHLLINHVELLLIYVICSYLLNSSPIFFINNFLSIDLFPSGAKFNYLLFVFNTELTLFLINHGTD